MSSPASVPLGALLDIDQVAERLKCSTRHVSRLARSGRMPRPLKLGALVRWSPTAIDRWIANGCPYCESEASGCT